MASGVHLAAPAPDAPAAPRAPVRPVCPECGASFTRRAPHQLFCMPAHQVAWENRWTVRGKKIAQLAACTRATRDGSRGDRETGKRAAGDFASLIQRYADEDRKAGRMDIVEFTRRRYAAGFDPLT